MNKLNTKDNKGYKIILVVVLIVVLLTSCVFIGSILAWLKDRDAPGTEDVITIGSVDFEIYSGENKLTATKQNADGVTTATSAIYEITDVTTIKDVDLTIRNTGTVNAIIRARVRLYYIDAQGNACTPIIMDTPVINNSVDIENPGWVNDFKGVSAGYTYYNSQIKPYTISSIVNGEVSSEDVETNAVSLFTQILVPEAMRTETYYLEVTVEGVAYSGNIYQEEIKAENGDIPPEGVGAYPFRLPSSLPASWTAWKE
jgi:hypothetical protein